MSSTDCVQKLSLFYVAAKDEDGANVDLIVREEDDKAAKAAWRKHYTGWDLPAEPASVVEIPVDGPPGAIVWSDLIPD